MLVSVLQVVWLSAAVGLVILVLFHSPKGDGLGALGGQAQMFTSTKSAETALNRATWTLTILFMGITVILSAGWLDDAVATDTAVPDVGTPVENTAPAPESSIPSSLGESGEAAPAVE